MFLRIKYILIGIQKKWVIKIINLYKLVNLEIRNNKLPLHEMIPPYVINDNWIVQLWTDIQKIDGQIKKLQNISHT